MTTNIFPRTQVGTQASLPATSAEDGLIYASETAISIGKSGAWVTSPNALAGATNSGTTTLVAGTKNVVVTGLVATSKVFVEINTMHQGAGNLTRGIKAVAGAGSFDVTATLADGTVNAADVSVVRWYVIR